MNATTQPTLQALRDAAMDDSVKAFNAMPVPQSEQGADAIKNILDLRTLRAEHFPLVVKWLHDYAVDNFEPVVSRMKREHQLEFCSDRYFEAFESDRIDNEDFPEADAFSRY